jgi:hypothetical protein
MLGALDAYNGAVLVLDPIVARELAALGFETKEQLIDWVHREVRAPARRYWDNYTTRNMLREFPELDIEPFASYARAEPDEPIPMFQPDWIHVLVTGGSSIASWNCFNARILEQPGREDMPGATVSVDAWR